MQKIGRWFLWGWGVIVGFLGVLYFPFIGLYLFGDLSAIAALSAIQPHSRLLFVSVLTVVILGQVLVLISVVLWKIASGHPDGGCHWLLAVPIVLIVLVLCFSGLLARSQLRRAFTQRRLAKEYGVAIEDYEWPEKFPVGYYKVILRKGTSARQVHDVIQGYDEVRHCDFDDVEIYSYYSGGAVMGIYYTPDGNLDRVRVYDDSESYSWESCRPGQRPE